MPEAFFAMMLEDRDELWADSMFWIAAMAIISIFAGVNTYYYKYSFGIVGQGLTKQIRKITYSNILRKHVGWYDERENNPGNLTTMLQADVQSMNGVSQEGLGITIESFAGIFTGLLIAFLF